MMFSSGPYCFVVGRISSSFVPIAKLVSISSFLHTDISLRTDVILRTYVIIFFILALLFTFVVGLISSLSCAPIVKLASITSFLHTDIIFDVTSFLYTDVITPFHHVGRLQ